ncbi:MAG: phosphatase PAP2 family protein, partial [Dehalococcoidia bacterium]
MARIRRTSTRKRHAFWTAWLVAVAAFVVVCGFAAVSDRFPGDLALARRVQDFNDFHFGPVAGFANTAGGTWLAIVITLAFAAAFLFLKRPWESVIVVGTFVPRALRQALAQAVARPRPSAALLQVRDHVSGYSFPSGHATTAFVLYGTLFVLAGALIPHAGLRLLFRAACVTMIILTGLARVYVGVHWPS